MSDTELAIPTKEVEEESRSIAPIAERALSITIESPDDVKEGEELLTTIKQAKKQLTARKEAITRPAMAALASIRDLFRGPEEVLVGAEKEVKQKMLAYGAAEDARIEAEQAAIDAKLASGKIKESTAVARTMAVDAPTKMKTRTIIKVRIVDETLIPREWMTPNLKEITKAMLETDLAIPGAEKYKEKILAA